MPLISNIRFIDEPGKLYIFSLWVYFVFVCIFIKADRVFGCELLQFAVKYLTLRQILRAFRNEMFRAAQHVPDDILICSLHMYVLCVYIFIYNAA